MTKNAIHGGVESLIRLESEKLNADVFVAGGLNNYEGTCPFTYQYVDNYSELVNCLRQYEGVLYHWLPTWAVRAIGDSGILSVEFVHRVDTAECDKSVPDIIVSHSKYVCEYIKAQYGRECKLVPNVVDTDFYVPSDKKKNWIGAVTSYYDTKGIDILIKAWQCTCPKFPQYELHLYGTGEQKKEYMNLAKKMNVDVKFHDSIPNSKIAYDDLKLVLSASRIEGLPIALLEAMSCNLPILASDIEGHKIINKLAVENGFEPPIRLFKSEDVEDLSRKLNATLSDIDNNVVHTRDVALGVFSPMQHIEGIKRAFYFANFCHRDTKRSLCKITTDNDVNYYLYDVANRSKEQFRFVTTRIENDYYILAEMSLINEMKCIMFSSEVRIDKYCNISIQIDWIYENQKQSVGEGIYLDHLTNKVFTMKDIPSDKPQKAIISVRPNRKESFELKTMNMWAEE